MNTIKISTIAGGILAGAIMCSALIANSKEALAFTSNPIVEPSVLFQEVIQSPEDTQSLND